MHPNVRMIIGARVGKYGGAGTAHFHRVCDRYDFLFPMENSDESTNLRLYEILDGNETSTLKDGLPDEYVSDVL